MKKLNKNIAKGLLGVTPPSVVPLPSTGSGDIYSTAVGIFNYALMFVGLVALAFLVWGGVLFVTSGGDEAKVTKARNTILYAVVGIVVVLLAIGIINWLKNFAKGV